MRRWALIGLLVVGDAARAADEWKEFTVSCRTQTKDGYTRCDNDMSWFSGKKLIFWGGKMYEPVGSSPPVAAPQRQAPDMMCVPGGGGVMYCN